MSFAELGNLAWLLPLGGAVVALYLLRMKRRQVVVPARFLWPERLDEIRANSLFQKLRFNWLMVLQLLALALAVVAWAHPQKREKGLAGHVTVVVLDASASMSARDVEPSRFDQGVGLVARMVAAEQPGDQVALIVAEPIPRVVFPLSSDPARQRVSLEGLKCTQADVDVGEALRLAAALVSANAGAKIVLISDGVFPPVTDFSPGRADVLFQKVGRSGDNLGVNALGVTSTQQGKTVYVSVKNHGRATSAKLTLAADGVPFNSFALEIQSGSTWAKTLPCPQGAGVVEAFLTPGDNLLADDYAACLAGSGGSLKVLLVGKGDFFLERALALDPRVTLDRSVALPPSEAPDSKSSYDLTVFDGAPEQACASPFVLCLGSAGRGSPVTASGSHAPGDFVSATDSPLNRGVDWGSVYIDKAQHVRPTGDGTVLAETKDGPLLVASQTKQTHIFLAFTPLDSDFPLQVGFPIFVANVLDMAGKGASSGAICIRSGQPFAWTARGEKEAVLTLPDKTEIHVSAIDERFMVPAINQVGRCTLKVGEAVRPIYVSLQSDAEGAIQPVDGPEIGGKPVKATGGLERLADYWKPAALLCLLVLAGEWWLYARRS